MSLLLAEIRRLLARRAVVVLLLVGVLLAALVTGGVMYDGRPIGQADLANAQEQIDGSIAECERNPRRYGGRGDVNCERIVGDPQDYLYRQVLTPATVLEGLRLPLTFLLGLLALLIGTTFVGAEWASGSMSNLMLFEPRRGRVWSAKVVAVALVTTLFALLTLGIAVAVATSAAVAWSDVAWSADRSWSAVWATARAISIVVLLAVVGVALTLALRSTIATVGLALGYALVGETVLRAVLGQLVAPWLLSSHLLAYLLGKLRLVSYDNFSGRPDVTVLHLQTSAPYLGVLLAVLLLVSYLTFRRRDIA